MINNVTSMQAPQPLSAPSRISVGADPVLSVPKARRATRHTLNVSPDSSQAPTHVGTAQMNIAQPFRPPPASRQLRSSSREDKQEARARAST